MKRFFTEDCWLLVDLRSKRREKREMLQNTMARIVVLGFPYFALFLTNLLFWSNQHYISE